MTKRQGSTLLLLILSLGFTSHLGCDDKFKGRSGNSEAREPGEETETIPGYLSDDRKDAGAGEPSEITSEGTTVSVGAGAVNEDYTVRLRRMSSVEEIISTTLIHSVLAEPVQVDLYRANTEQHLPVESLNDGVRVSSLIPEKPEGTELMALVVIDPGLPTEERGYILEEDMSIVAVNQTALSAMFEATIYVLATSFEAVIVAANGRPGEGWKNLAAKGVVRPISKSGDLIPPSIEEGKLSFQNLTPNGFTVGWKKATDNLTAQNRLSYKLYYILQDNVTTPEAAEAKMSSPEAAEANGTASGPATADVDSLVVVSLLPSSLYYITVVVRDEAGNKASYPVASVTTLKSFSQRSFTTPEYLVATDDYDATNPRLASDVAGNTIVAYICDPPSDSPNICTIRFDAGTGRWSDPTTIDNLSGNVEYLSLAMDPRLGNAMAVWSQVSGPRRLIYASFYNADDQAWSDAVALESGTGSEYSNEPVVTLGGSGDAFVTWVRSPDGFNFEIRANSYNAKDGTWATAQIISPPGTGSNNSKPRVAADHFGNAVIAWLKLDSGTYNLCVNHFVPASRTWGSPVLVENETGNANEPQIYFNQHGDALVGWLQSTGGGYGKIFTARYPYSSNSSSNWGTPKAELTSSQPSDPAFAVNQDGDMVAFWSSYDGVSEYTIWSNRFTAASEKWEQVVTIKSGNSVWAGNPRTAFDSSGNGIALWQTSGDYHAARFNAATSIWSTEEGIGNGGAEYSIVNDGHGSFTIVWQKSSMPRTHLWYQWFK